MGLNKEAVVMAIRTFGDIQNKVWLLSFPLCLGMELVSLSLCLLLQEQYQLSSFLCAHMPIRIEYGIETQKFQIRTGFGPLSWPRKIRGRLKCGCRHERIVSEIVHSELPSELCSCTLVYISQAKSVMDGCRWWTFVQLTAGYGRWDSSQMLWLQLWPHVTMTLSELLLILLACRYMLITITIYWSTGELFHCYSTFGAQHRCCQTQLLVL